MLNHPNLNNARRSYDWLHRSSKRLWVVESQHYDLLPWPSCFSDLFLIVSWHTHKKIASRLRWQASRIGGSVLKMIKFLVLLQMNHFHSWMRGHTHTHTHLSDRTSSHNVKFHRQTQESILFQPSMENSSSKHVGQSCQDFVVSIRELYSKFPILWQVIAAERCAQEMFCKNWISR